MSDHGQDDWRTRFIGMDGSDPAVRLMLTMERIFLLPKTLAHPSSRLAKLQGDTTQGRSMILNLAWGLCQRTKARSHVSTSILDSLTWYGYGGWQPRPVKDARIPLHAPEVRADGDTELEAMARFAMLNPGWARGMADALDDILADGMPDDGLIANLARMVGSAFNRHAGGREPLEMMTGASVCAGMILNTTPKVSWTLPQELPDMGMGGEPGPRHVVAMLRLLDAGLDEGLRLAAATHPLFASDGRLTPGMIKEVDDRVNERAESEGQRLVRLQTCRCDWRALCALADGTMPLRMFFMSSSERADRERTRMCDPAIICDRMARMDFMKPDPERMISLLKAIIPSKAPCTAESDIRCMYHNDCLMISEDSSEGIAASCVVSGDVQAVVAINAIWDMLHIMRPAMRALPLSRNSGRDEKWPTLPGSAVIEAVHEYASHSLPESFIAEGLAGRAGCYDPKACGVIINIRNDNDGGAQVRISIDWSC